MVPIFLSSNRRGKSWYSQALAEQFARESNKTLATFMIYDEWNSISKRPSTLKQEYEALVEKEPELKPNQVLRQQLSKLPHNRKRMRY